MIEKLQISGVIGDDVDANNIYTATSANTYVNDINPNYIVEYDGTDNWSIWSNNGATHKAILSTTGYDALFTADDWVAYDSDFTNLVLIEYVEPIVPMELPLQERQGRTNLFLNPTAFEEWDLVLDAGQLITISNKNYIGQKVKQLLLTSVGEVVTDTKYGIPYIQEILGVKNPNLETITSIILDVLEDDEVLKQLGVVAFEVTHADLDKINRVFTLSINIVVSDGTTITVDGINL